MGEATCRLFVLCLGLLIGLTVTVSSSNFQNIPAGILSPNVIDSDLTKATGGRRCAVTGPVVLAPSDNVKRQSIVCPGSLSAPSVCRTSGKLSKLILLNFQWA